jgi:hypothetical protein
VKTRLHFAIALLILLAAPPAPAGAQDAASAKAFLESAYQLYRNGGKGIDFTGPRASQYFHSSLLTLIHADIKANGPDNVPAIDYDPICGCQDWDGIWDLNVEVTAESAQKAEANLSFSLRNPKFHDKDELRRLKITLVAEHSGWRIYDIVDESDPKMVFSMRKQLEDDLAAIRKEKQPRDGH